MKEWERQSTPVWDEEKFGGDVGDEGLIRVVHGRRLIRGVHFRDDEEVSL